MHGGGPLFVATVWGWQVGWFCAGCAKTPLPGGLVACDAWFLASATDGRGDMR